MLGEKSQALSTTPAVFESRLGKRLIANQILNVFVIVVRSLLPGALMKPPLLENASPGEKPSLLASNSSLTPAAGPWGWLGGGKVHGGISAGGTRMGGQMHCPASGCHWLQCCSRAGGARGSVCPPACVRCLCWSPQGSERGCLCPRRVVTMLVAPVSSRGRDKPSPRGRCCSECSGETEA